MPVLLLDRLSVRVQFEHDGLAGFRLDLPLVVGLAVFRDGLELRDAAAGLQGRSHRRRRLVDVELLLDQIT